MADGFNPSGSLPRVLKILIAANVIVWMIDKATDGRYLYNYMSLDPYQVLHLGQVWRLVTYLFLHDLSVPPIHLLLNMLILWMFGTAMAETLGERKFWWFYISTGVFSGICSLIFYSITNNPTTVIGASGALFGLMFAFAKFFPTQQFLMFFLFPVQARYAVIIIGLVELLSITSHDRIAHVAHLGGALFAWLYFRLEDRGASLVGKWKERKSARVEKAVRKHEEEIDQAMVDIDPILKKISQHGIQSLSRDEKEKLEKASELKRKAKSKLISFDEYRKRQ
jgi:membrane associated rhomboid family serine protease